MVSDAMASYFHSRNALVDILSINIIGHDKMSQQKSCSNWQEMIRSNRRAKRWSTDIWLWMMKKHCEKYAHRDHYRPAGRLHLNTNMSCGTQTHIHNASPPAYYKPPFPAQPISMNNFFYPAHFIQTDECVHATAQRMAIAVAMNESTVDDYRTTPRSRLSKWHTFLLGAKQRRLANNYYENIADVFISLLIFLPSVFDVSLLFSCSQLLNWMRLF